jgi:hypothetical protein
VERGERRKAGARGPGGHPLPRRVLSVSVTHLHQATGTAKATRKAAQDGTSYSITWGWSTLPSSTTVFSSRAMGAELTKSA